MSFLGTARCIASFIAVLQDRCTATQRRLDHPHEVGTRTIRDGVEATLRHSLMHAF